MAEIFTSNFRISEEEKVNLLVNVYQVIIWVIKGQWKRRFLIFEWSSMKHMEQISDLFWSDNPTETS